VERGRACPHELRRRLSQHRLVISPFQARAEDLHVVENLIVNKGAADPDIAYFRTDADPVSTATFLLMHAQEFHTSVWDTSACSARVALLAPEYAGYPNTAASSLALTNATLPISRNAQGAVVGYVHPFDTKPDPADTTVPLYYELPVDAGARQSGITWRSWGTRPSHHVRDLVPLAQRDFGCRGRNGCVPRLREPPRTAGLVRVLSSRSEARSPSLARGLQAGRTFVTNAPLLEFSLAGHAIR